MPTRATLGFCRLSRARATVTKDFYDNLGRETYVAQNWQNFVPPSTGTGNPKDRVTQYIYDGPSRLQQLVAMDPNGTGTLTNNQVTTYLYVDPVDANQNTTQIYPDSTDTTSSGTNQIKLAYNVDSSLSSRTDQRGVVLSYAYTNNRLLATESVLYCAYSVPHRTDAYGLGDCGWNPFKWEWRNHDFTAVPDSPPAPPPAPVDTFGDPAAGQLTMHEGKKFSTLTTPVRGGPVYQGPGGTISQATTGIKIVGTITLVGGTVGVVVPFAGEIAGASGRAVTTVLGKYPGYV
jgi:hypothetical protein